MAGRGASERHTTLINDLCKDCDSEIFTNLKTFVKSKEFGGLRAGELEKLKDPRDLLERLERKRVFKDGDYGKLKRLFEKAEFTDGIDTIEELEQEMGGEAMEQDDNARNTNVNNGNQGLMSRLPPQQRLPPSTTSYSSSGPSALSPQARQRLRDQHDASPFIPPVPVYQKGRGYLLFINLFVNEGGFKKRQGASLDEDNIKMVFLDFIRTFALNIKTDLKKRDLFRVLDDVSGELERNDYKSFMCIICSHGERHEVESDGKKAFREGFLTIDDQLVTEDEVTEKFKAHKVPKLNGCPKVFIFQCCRGTAPGRGTLDRADSTDVEPGSYSAAAPIDMADGPKPVNLPRNADMLIVHSTSKGTKAWRNERDGSWFIKSFCESLKLCHKVDHILDILLRVNADVGEKESSEGGAKQMPCQVSTLTKKFMVGE